MLGNWKKKKRKRVYNSKGATDKLSKKNEEKARDNEQI